MLYPAELRDHGTSLSKIGGQWEPANHSKGLKTARVRLLAAPLRDSIRSASG